MKCLIRAPLKKLFYVYILALLSSENALHIQHMVEISVKYATGTYRGSCLEISR